ncbi:hypothetical protein RRG08_026306 [Elysia crispata]|uniref:Uncharacterized protein n=1 Tax=Elysia crispata TaxID=231223 RepID=A0AAE1DCP0_9GAST|nr:hypothetical protein RRG08_026306 [Elysia crispata]
MMRRKTNRGHSLEVLPDIHPFEADDISALTTANGTCTRLGSLRAGQLPCIQDHKGPWDTEEKTTSVPAIHYQDGRPYNRLAVRLFKEDPCKYYRNVYPWDPEQPRALIPHPVAYKGLGKPPVRQYFKLTPKRVTSEFLMPSYEVLRPDNTDALCHYYKNAV